MNPKTKVCCMLCLRSEETKITGPLSIKKLITAHQNCLLYSSGICCQSSPLFDDLFGFSAEDVNLEVKRGKKLYCDRCKKKGATVGCELRRCRKSFHYPCAIEQGAKRVENKENGTYVLYCSKHIPGEETVDLNSQNNSSTAEPKSSTNPNEARSRKRRLSSSDIAVPVHSKLKRRILDDTSDSGGDEADMAIFAPLESDIDDSGTSDPVNGGVVCHSPGSAQTPGPEPDRPSDGQENSGRPSNLLPPSTPHDECCTSSPVSPGNNNTGTHSPTPPVHPSTPPPPVLTPALISAHLPCASSPVPLHSFRASDPEINIDAVTFWRSCNQAACTQAIFSDFLNDINDIFCRIQSDQASHEDYITALRVMEASGNLSELMAKQEKELNKRQEELLLAVAAMKKARSVLKQKPAHDS